MPANPSAPASADLPRGILLVEDYQALGVAISTALHKFAPLHGVRVARNFAEAEAAAAVMRPELFVVDVDPPLLGDIEFFNKLKAHYPDSRALVIAPGTSRELRAERGTAGAIQFIEKPFDLAEFGAAVQALLGPWGLPPSSNLRGTLRDLHVVDIVQLKCLALSTAVVCLEATDGRSGEIFFKNGQIFHAATAMLRGAGALEEILSWADGTLSEEELPADWSRTIDAAWPALLRPFVRKLAEHERKSLGATAARRATVARSGKKILVIDDTEMLLVFVADVLETANQTFQIITAPTGAEGLILAETARPDLVLLDYSLTDTTGDEVCRALLEKEATARIPVLLMSGHLSELARTAEDYENVVASLPKPFLSGELISTVENLLALGPLSETPRPKAAPKLAPVTPEPAPSPASFAEGPATPLPNGHGRSSDGGPAKPQPPPPAEVLPPIPPPAGEPPKSSSVEPALPPTPPGSPLLATTEPPLVRQSEVSVTLSLQVVSMQITPSLRMEGMKLQPVSSTVAVKMAGRDELNGIPLETGFRLGTIGLGADDSVVAIRLIPTRQPPQLPVAGSSFAPGAMNLQPGDAQQNLQLTSQADKSMRVRLTAAFELLTVELTADFEVAAVLLRPTASKVFIRNSSEGEGAPFEIEEVELDAAAELLALLVRALP